MKKVALVVCLMATTIKSYYGSPLSEAKLLGTAQPFSYTLSNTKAGDKETASPPKYTNTSFAYVTALAAAVVYLLWGGYAPSSDSQLDEGLELAKLGKSIGSFLCWL